MKDLLRARLNAPVVYVILQFCTAFLFSLIFTVNLLYHVEVVKLMPLQLVLVGTTLESTVFLFEIPTGILADAKSRRLSVIVGYMLMGLGFLVEGSFTLFLTVVGAQVLWGLGYTFTSGATQAWIADEVGADRAGWAYLRGAQAGQIGSLVAIPLSVSLGRGDLALPIVLGGVCMILLAAFLALVMPENGFAPRPAEEREAWQVMLRTMRDARESTRRQPVLLTLLGIGLFYGLYSEGLDRLWTVHLLQNYQFPYAGRVEPVVWFGVIRAIAVLAGLLATEMIRRRVDTSHALKVGRALLWDAAGIIGALAGFALTRHYWVALALYWVVDALRGVIEPLYSAWLNSYVHDSQVRATMFSVGSQVDAVGQILGGPLVGAIGNIAVRAALAASALILLPVLPLYAVAIHRGKDLGTGISKVTILPRRST